MKIEKMAHEAIEEGFNELKEMKKGTDEYDQTVNSLTKLMDRAIEIDKLNVEHEEKEVQMKEDKRDRIVKNVLNGVGVVGGLAVTVWGACKSWKFEENGTITSSAGRKFMNLLFFKK